MAAASAWEATGQGWAGSRWIRASFVPSRGSRRTPNHPVRAAGSLASQVRLGRMNWCQTTGAFLWRRYSSSWTKVTLRLPAFPEGPLASNSERGSGVRAPRRRQVLPMESLGKAATAHIPLETLPPRRPAA
jgi:hypothetical protein